MCPLSCTVLILIILRTCVEKKHYLKQFTFALSFYPNCNNIHVTEWILRHGLFYT
jgi:hypothetical protein